MPLLSKIQSLLYADVGIDLGTKNTVIYIKDQGVVLSEPSMVALDEQTRDVVAFGQEAYDMIGKTPAHIISARPMREGVIADFTMAEKMIQSFLESIRHHISMKKPRLLFGIPWGITTVEKRAVLNAGRLSGVKHPMLIDEPMAAAIGSGLDVQAPNGKLIIDIGGGTTEIAVISMAGIVACQSIRTAGDHCDDAIREYIRKEHNLLIGEQSAEKIKMTIGSASPLIEELTMTVTGQDRSNGLPQSIDLSSIDIRHVLQDPINVIIDGVRQTLEETPPELSADLMSQPVYVTGGGALLKGLGQRIEDELQLNVQICDNPLDSVAVGTGAILENKDLFSSIKGSLIK